MAQNTHFTFRDFSEARRRELICEGGAHFPDRANFLRLTRTDDNENPQPNSVGRVLYLKPVNFGMAGAKASFETTVRFTVKANEDNTLHGDGLVFFIVPEGYEFPGQPEVSDGGNLGVFDPSGQSPNVFAVEFDVFPNESWDPPYMHVGIDIGSRSSAKFAKISGKFIGEEVTLTVTYDARSTVMRADVRRGAEIIPVTHVFDLSTMFPSKVKVGLAASTGEVADIFDVAFWEFRSILQAA